MICGKCFQALPANLRQDHQRQWREYRKWGRRITRTSDELKRRRMADVRDHFAGAIAMSWDAIRTHVLAGERPEGLDAILDELGLS